jgi:hypothetical protein
MNIKNSLLILAMVTASSMSAHNCDHLLKEQLLILNAKLFLQNACLKEELAKAKHKLHEEHPFHQLEKDIARLIKG